jgi:cobalt-zinc-cadmium efflux system outer membrane protein
VAEARAITARLRPNPVLTVSGQSLNLLGANFSPNTPLGPNQTNIHTDFPIERGGKRQSRVVLAREQKNLAELEVRELMRQVIVAVHNAFVDVQQAKALLQLAKENLQSLQGVVTINEARLKNGDLAEVELERSRLAALQSQARVEQAQLQLEQAKIQLQLLIGRKQTAPDFEIAGDLRADAPAFHPTQLSELALSRRPDYLLTVQSQATSRADLKLQIANGRVDFVVGSEYTYQRAWGVGGSSLGVSISVPLKLYNKNQGEIARAQREISSAEARTAALSRSIHAEIEKALQQYQVAGRLLDSIKRDMLDRARTVRNTTEYSYRRGEASLVEFLDAQRAFNETMEFYNTTRANYARSLYLLDAVSGANPERRETSRRDRAPVRLVRETGAVRSAGESPRQRSRFSFCLALGVPHPSAHCRARAGGPGTPRNVRRNGSIGAGPGGRHLRTRAH